MCEKECLKQEKPICIDCWTKILNIPPQARQFINMRGQRGKNKR